MMTMRSSRSSRLTERAAGGWAPLAAAFVAGTIAGCTSGPMRPSGPVVCLESGKKLLLREKYAEGVQQRYEMVTAYRATGESSVRENARSVLYRQPIGTTAGKYMNLYLRRRDLSRRRTERTMRGHVIVETSPLDLQPVLSPLENRIVTKQGQHLYPCDDRRRFAFTEERPFHQLNYISIGFFFPILPKAPVTTGDAWSGGRLRAMIGFKYYWNNDFPLRSAHTLREFRSVNGHTVAVIDYEFSGHFDSAEVPERFTEDWRSQGRVTHDVSGDGTAYFDVDAGVVIWKRDRGSVRVTREFHGMARTKTTGARKTTTTDTDVVVTKTQVDITQRLMRPGERLPGTGPRP